VQSLHEDESMFPPFISFAGFGTHDYIYSFAMAWHDRADCGQREYLLDRARFWRLRPKNRRIEWRNSSRKGQATRIERIRSADELGIQNQGLRIRLPGGTFLRGIDGRNYTKYRENSRGIPDRFAILFAFWRNVGLGRGTLL